MRTVLRLLMASSIAFCAAGIVRSVAQDTERQATDAGQRAQEDYAFRAGDTAASYAARLRAAAAPLGGECTAERAQIEAFAASVAVDLPKEVEAGKPAALSWRAESVPLDVPAWLIVAADEPARFSGEGFYALTPGATAPFGIEAGAGRTRAVAALFGAGAAREGEVGIVPLAAGHMNVRVHIAAFLRGCGQEWSAEITAAPMAVSVSPDAVFFVRDPFSFEEPRRVLASPDGATGVEVFEERYRLIEAENGALLADREGTIPNYSPTGRFLAARTQDGIDVLDTIDGKLLATLPAGDVGWENGDSFVLSGEPQNGAITAFNTLAAGYRIASDDQSLDCTVCPARGVRLVVDLENDIFLRIGGQGYAATRLSGARDAVSGMIDTFDDESTAAMNDALGAFWRKTAAVPPRLPASNYWDLRGGLRFTSLDEEFEATGNDVAYDAWLGRMKAALIEPKDAPRRLARPGVLSISDISRKRGARLLTRPPAKPDAMTVRLQEFGLAFPAARRPDFAKHDLPDEAADLAIAERIAADVPQARGIFQPKDFGCVPEGDSAQTPKIYAYFNDAIQFRLRDRVVWLTLFSCKWTAGGAYEANFFLFDSKAEGTPVRLGEDNPDGPHLGACQGNIGFCDVEAAIAGDGRLLVWSRESRAILVYDLDERRTAFQGFDLARGDLLKEVRYSPQSRHLLQINKDGSFFVHDTDGGSRVLEGRYVDDETIAWTPDLQFDASAEGANYVSLRFPGRKGEYTFKQFEQRVRRPGLVKAVLERNWAREPVLVATPPRLSGELAAAEERITGILKAEGASEVRVHQDGLVTDVLPVGPNGSVAVDVARLPGTRWVSVLAANAGGLVSLPLGRDIGGEGLPVVHAIAIGVDNYDAPDISDLGFAARDATTLAAALERLDGDTLRLGTSARLIDAQASPQEILEQARALVQRAKPGETIVISFAGHGLTGADGRFYMATTGASLADPGSTTLPWDELAAILTRARARVIVLLDACHSGAAGTGLFATNDAAADGVMRSIPSGLLVFAASKGRQLSEESGALGGGVFTNAVADVIARQRGTYDLDGNGAIEISELYAGVKQRVSQLTDGRQVPWLTRNEMVGDFALF